MLSPNSKFYTEQNGLFYKNFPSCGILPMMIQDLKKYLVGKELELELEGENHKTSKMRLVDTSVHIPQAYRILPR